MIINNHNHLSNRSASSKLIEMKISRIRSHCSHVDSRVVTLGHKSRQFSPKRNNISLAVRGPKKARRKARKSTKTTKPIPLPPGCAGAEACGRILHSKTRRTHSHQPQLNSLSTGNFESRTRDLQPDWLFFLKYLGRKLP
jgi:hypothetical protein